MSTGVIIALIVIVAAVLVVAAAVTLLARRPQGGRSLQRRFGPEYDRAVARHNGDVKAAEQDLAERVSRHGSLRERALEPAAREQYAARWAAAQERFVESPREAVAEVDQLLGEVAGARGFPDGGQYDEQYAALSVHHGPHVHGYRRVHRAAQARVPDGQGSTEELREAMIEARVLFDELVTPSGKDTRRHRTDTDENSSIGRSRAIDTRPEGSAHEGRFHLPWSFNKHQAKGS
ncbi:hypothetical protein ACFYPC_09170 [Streptomyces sp. NPDC005808]|uniref:hypothetical protein n=1 Tax=Streptomyces sp. NPDC005808 TaxID=3364734 RepID=UPI00367E2587